MLWPVVMVAQLAVFLAAFVAVAFNSLYFALKPFVGWTEPCAFTPCVARAAKIPHAQESSAKA